MPAQTYWKVLTRRKCLKNETEGETKLNRVLGLFDLTALGVGSTLGAGVYVLAGQIAKDQAGPSVMISFTIAALASVLAGVCYAEFGARVPRAGSAYIYSYVCIGEFVAFVIGWNLILEYIIGTAGVCRGISLYLDTLLNDTLKTSFAEIAPIEWNFLGGYFDFLAFTLAVVFGVATSFGVETSTMLNNFCTILNISVLLFVIVAGSIKADISNWQVDPSNNLTATNYNIGKGGYFPFGFEGTLKGAATCFFGFVGFDCIATTGEEVRNPQRNIPRSILYSLLIIFLCYFGVSTVLTLMVPYYKQDPNAPLPYAFKEVGWNFAMWTVTVGGLIGLLASLFGALFPIPRIIYSMAEDGLLFQFLGKVSPRFKTPVVGSIFASFLTGIISGIFDLPQLVNLLSIGTLLAYTVVAISITLLRFMNNDGETNSYRSEHLTESSMLTSNGTKIRFKTILYQMFNFQRLSTPNSLSTKIVGSLILSFCIISLLCGLLIMNAGAAIINHELWALVLLSIFVSLLLIVLTAIWTQPKEVYISIFRVPLVPLVPAISIFINVYLMLQLDVMTWIRFGVWTVIGLPIFMICYCTFNKSNKRVNKRKQLFMKALQKLNILCNDPSKFVENGVYNSSVKILVSQRSEQDTQQTNNGVNFHDPPSLNEITLASFMTKSEQSKEGDCNISTVDEENSVIAMLDDVLDNEDDDVTNRDYAQQISIDSDNIPSFVTATTVALIHSNCDPRLYKLQEADEASSTLIMDNIFYTEVWQLAFDLVDAILRSDELILRVEAKRKCIDEKQDSRQLYNISFKRSKNNSNHTFDNDRLHSDNDETNDPVQLYSTDIVKQSSNNSKLLDITHHSFDNDPLHSDKFKNKLSLLIAQPPGMYKVKKDENPISPTTELNHELKLSKSETDIRKMILISVEGASKEAPLFIPTPPKFDPVLYKTVGHRTQNISNTNFWTRPKIDNLIEGPIRLADTTEILEEEVPFKTKLEAILKRGPSHRMQKHVDLTTPKRGLSVDNHSLFGKRLQHNMLKQVPHNKAKILKSATNVKFNSNTRDVINEIRKNLRHVTLNKEQ